MHRGYGVVLILDVSELVELSVIKAVRYYDGVHISLLISEWGDRVCSTGRGDRSQTRTDNAK